MFLVGWCSPSSWCEFFFGQHDAQMDYYGTRLATCSSDRTVKIFDVRNGGQILVADLRGWDAYYYLVAGKPFCWMFLVLTKIWIPLSIRLSGYPSPSIPPHTLPLYPPLSPSLHLCLLTSPLSHEGPVWQVAGAHPMYGNILASCSYDRKVIVWKEENGSWDKMYEYTGHESSSGEL